MAFSKVYRNGDFKALVTMYSFDRHVESHRSEDWNEVKELFDLNGDIVGYTLVGESAVLPLNK